MKKASFFERLTTIRENEKGATLCSFFLIFLLMSAYYILRPVRDAFASDWTDAEVSFLWTLNFFFSTFGVFLYGWAVSHISIRKIAFAVYLFFALTFFGFDALIALWKEHPVLINKGFYVWVSLFSLFNVSVFWSFMSHIFKKEEATRLFAIIGAGASAGALIGPGIPTLFAERLGAGGLLILASGLLLVALPLIGFLNQKEGDGGVKSSEEYLGKNPFSGFKDFIKNPYLLGIGVFIVFYTSVATVAYFMQKNLLETFSLTERSQILGAIDWVVNFLTFFVAFFATGRLVKYTGMPFTLSSVPFFMSLAFLGLALSPVIMIVFALQVARRAGNYAISRPAREMLFTQVTPEERFKAKPVIDIVCYRGGDMVSSWVFAFLTQGLGWGLSAMAGFGGVVCLIWGGVSILLGKTFEGTKEA